MSTSQVAFYTNRVGNFEKMRRYRQTKPGSYKITLWHIYSRTPTHKLITLTQSFGTSIYSRTPTNIQITMHRRCAVINVSPGYFTYHLQSSSTKQRLPEVPAAHQWSLVSSTCYTVVVRILDDNTVMTKMTNETQRVIEMGYHWNFDGFRVCYRTFYT